MIKSLRILSILFSLMFLSPNVYSETLTMWGGLEIKGRLGEQDENIVKMYGDKYYALELNNIRDARVDDDATGKEVDEQQERVEKLYFVIDRNRFLRSDFRKNINKMLLERKFDELDELAEELLDKKSKYPTASWKLVDIYRGIDDDIQSRDIAGFEMRENLINDWIKAKPNSITAKIALMAVNISYAWAYRGSGVSSTVTRIGRQKFKEKLQKVIQIGDQLRSINASDPTLYNYLIVAYNGAGKSNQDIIILAAEAERIAPDYYPVYYKVMNALLPKWGGSYALTSAFIKSVVDNDKLQQTPEMYYWLIRYIKSEINDDKYGYYGFDWELIQKSFQAYSENYDVVDSDMHLMAKLASLHGDRESARKYFSESTGNWNHLARSVWGEKRIFKRFQSWSNETPDPDFTNALIALLSTKDENHQNNIIDIFVEAGGDLNRTDILGNTLLHLAIKKGRVTLVRKILAAGADANIFNSFGYAPLYLAAIENEPAISSVLISGGADINLGTPDGKNTAAHFAAAQGYDRIISVLLNKAPSLGNNKNLSGNTPLHLAALDGYLSTTQILKKVRNINLNAQSNSGDTPLHLAVSRGHVNVVLALLEADVDLDIKNALKHTALSLAKEKGFDEIVDALTDMGAADSEKVITKLDQEKAIELYEKASSFYNKKDYKKAISIFKEAIELNEGYATAYHTLAMTQWQFARDYEEANRNIVKAIKLNPAAAESYYIAGRINYSMRRPEKYKAYFQRYVKMAPDTYNTKDLKKNYASVLTNNLQQRISSGQSSENINIDSEKRWLYENYRYLLLVTMLLGLLLLLKLRKAKNRTE